MRDDVSRKLNREDLNWRKSTRSVETVRLLLRAFIFPKVTAPNEMTVDEVAKSTLFKERLYGLLRFTKDGANVGTIGKVNKGNDTHPLKFLCNNYL